MADEIVAILHDASTRGASAIHVEPAGNGYRVRARFGGALEVLRELSLTRGLEAIAKLREMAGMDTDRSDIESGRMTVQFPSGRFGFSLTVSVGARGDVATLYVQPPRGTPYFPDFTFEALGLVGEDRARMERALARPG